MSPSVGSGCPKMRSVDHPSRVISSERKTTCRAGPPMLSLAMIRTILRLSMRGRGFFGRALAGPEGQACQGPEEGCLPKGIEVGIEHRLNQKGE